MTGASSFVSPGAVRCDGFAVLTDAGFRFAGARGNGAPAFFLPPPNTRPSAMRAEDRHGLGVVVRAARGRSRRAPAVRCMNWFILVLSHRVNPCQSRSASGP
jgi:hypothetical protein